MGVYDECVKYEGEVVATRWCRFVYSTIILSSAWGRTVSVRCDAVAKLNQTDITSHCATQ